MKRTFIYSDEKSNKFWNIEISGNSFTVNYGKTGTAGQIQTKEFNDEAKCLKEAEKLIAEKTKKGYVETDEMPDTDKNPKKATEKVVVEADTSSGYGYLVDLESKDSIENTLKAVIKHLDGDEVMERIENDEMLFPEYGKMEDDELIEYERRPFRSSEDRFFSKAVSYADLQPLVVKYVKKVIKLQAEYGTVWADDETQAGVNAAYNLVEDNEKYLPLYIELVKECSDGEHDVHQYDEAEALMKKYGWKAETLPIVIQRVLVDMYAAELFKSDEAKKFLSSDDNINTLISVFIKETKGTHFANRIFHYKSLAKLIFPENEVDEYAEAILDYAQKGKTPTLAMLKKGNTAADGKKKVKYTFRDYKERINTALQNIGFSDLNNNFNYTSKITGSDDKQYYVGVALNEKNPVLVQYLSGVELKYGRKDEVKPETFRLFNEIYLMLPPDLAEFVYLPGYSTLATANSVKAFTPDLTSDMIENQFYTLFGFSDWVAKEFRQVNAGKKTCEEVKNTIMEMADNMQLPEAANPQFEEQLKKYLEKTKSITVLKHDTENHSFYLECNNPKTGKKAVGVVSYHPLIQKVSLTLPCYHGDMKGREEDIYEWCEQATKQIGGHVINNLDSNYVMIRHIVDEYTITDAKSLQSLLLFDLLDCFAPCLATGIQRIIDGEEPMDVLDDQLVYPDSDAKINLPDDLKEVGIYGEQGERMLLSFNNYGKEFLKK